MRILVGYDETLILKGFDYSLKFDDQLLEILITCSTYEMFTNEFLFYNP